MFIEIDESTVPERRLLAQVILLALNDACQPPYKQEGRLRMSNHAYTAMRFLMDETVAGLNEYATWLDMDPGNFRRHLLNIMADTSPKIIGEWDSGRRRIFRINLALWREQKGLDTMMEEEDNELA